MEVLRRGNRPLPVEYEIAPGLLGSVDPDDLGMAADADESQKVGFLEVLAGGDEDQVVWVSL